MKLLIVMLVLSVCLISCANKTVKVKDTARNINVEITEDGVVIEGDLKLSDDITLTVQEEE